MTSPEQWEKIRNKTPPTKAQSALGGRKGGAKLAARSAERRSRFIVALIGGAGIAEACDEVGVTIHTYRQWRKRYQDFRDRTDDIMQFQYDAADEDADLDFIAWRRKYLNADTPWFQRRIVEALEADDEPGSITLVLIPPEHGKTTLLEDWITYKLCTDKSYRVTYGSESQAHSRKVLRRVRNRLENDSPYPAMVAAYGPFAPQTGANDDHRGSQPWGQDFFDVHGRTNTDERDYSMVALGFGSQIAGSRTDLLVGDDLISRKNYRQSSKLLEDFRQDWLSRPGTKGRTVIIGTRVEDGDLYELMEKAQIIDRVIRIKAHDPLRIEAHGTPWLWPDRYSEDEYAKMRKNVGPVAWARNYQQQPRLAGNSTFTAEMIERVENPMRSVSHPPPKAAVGIISGLDPGFGVNATMVLAGSATRLWVLGGSAVEGLTNNQQIFDTVELDTRPYLRNDLPWLHLAIEDKAFQKGLLDDAALHDLRRRYGFNYSGHQTSTIKYDAKIGIPAMARDFNREVIELPGAGDPETKAFRAELDNQLMRWRPDTKGTELTQDLVMALWFGWLWWHRNAATLRSRADGPTITTAPLPWTPTVLPGGMTKMG